MVLKTGALLLVVCTVFFVALAEGRNDALCFGRNDTKSLSTFLYLIDGVVKERCGNKSNGNNTGGGETQAGFQPMDCSDLKRLNASTGIHTIWPRNRLMNGPIDVLCDMDDDGGGWTVFQRRGNFGNPTNYFYKTWNEYKVGFGNLSLEFWLGNDNIYAITNQRRYMLKVVLNDWNDVTRFASYNNFYIECERLNYALQLSGYSGTAGDSLMDGHNGWPFTTRDKENTRYRCARRCRGAWWYHNRWSCEVSNLNGFYLGNTRDGHGGVTWNRFREYHSLKDTFMKIRPAP